MKNYVSVVEKYRSLILDAERYVWQHPETGYREVKTAEYLAKKFEELGYTLTYAGDIPGFYTVFDTGRPGPEVLVLGEMDSLICKNHKESDPETGYVHACGHNVQCATLLGIAAVLTEPQVAERLCGRVRLCAVPAEELIEMSYRTMLKQQGKIKYFVGKAEFMRRGFFDGVDMAFMVHASSAFAVTAGAVGCVAKTVKYKGASAHAGGSPWNGKNALYAATQGITAANALRETFREEDFIRFHPIITNGGTAVNAIPETVTLESFVRGKTYEAIQNANRKINQALCGAALSLANNIEIDDMSGYAPLLNNADLMQLTKEAADLVIPEENFQLTTHVTTGSTDMGDLCWVMPVVHPYSAGAVGTSHGDDYYIADPERACIKSTKMQLAMLALLLENGGERAKQICADFKAPFASIKDYLEYKDTMDCHGERITYCEDGIAEVRLDG